MNDVELTMRSVSRMTTEEIWREHNFLSKKWNDLSAKYSSEDGHGGSPGEWIWERLGELEHELKKRGEKP
jgi:hypothetical protein